MTEPTIPLPSLLARLPALFPASSPLVLRPSAGGFASLAGRFSGGHAARWFAATDGQEGDRPFARAHSLCSLAEAVEVMRVADALRAEPGGYWVEPHWLAVASDGAGQHLMIDDHDGRVLAVAHDDDHVAVIAPSVEAWLGSLDAGHADGTVVWDEVFGLVEGAELERIAAFRRAQAERVDAPLTTSQKVGLFVALATLALALTVLVWFLETHR